MSRLVFDIGGTHLRLGLAEGDTLGVVEKVATPKDPIQALDVIGKFLKAHSAQVQDAVGGIAGTVLNGSVLQSPHLPKWDGFDLSTALARSCDIKETKLLNDAEIAGMGEAVLGAGKGSRIVAYLTVSTGVGGVLIVDGSVVPHAVGHEPGKQILDHEGMRSLEDLVSGAALEKEFGHPPEELPHQTLLARTRVLAIGLYNTIRHWSPDVLIIGGALMNDTTGYPLSVVSKELSELPIELPRLPRILSAGLGDQSGLCGAAIL